MNATTNSPKIQADEGGHYIQLPGGGVAGPMGPKAARFLCDHIAAQSARIAELEGALRDIVESVEHSPQGIRTIKAAERARALLAKKESF